MVTAIILAAGRSTRFGESNKLLANLDDAPVLARTIEAASEVCHGRVVVVTGHDRAAVDKLALSLGAATSHNPRFDLGMGTSIAAGVAFAAASPGWLIWPGDMPFIRIETARLIVAAAHDDLPVVPVCEGQRGHPVLFPASARVALVKLTGDQGARHLLGPAIQLQVNDPGILRDVDVPGELVTGVPRSRGPREI